MNKIEETKCLNVCFNCKFFEHLWEDSDYGRCVRRAPVAYQGHAGTLPFAVFPEIHYLAHCGELKIDVRRSND